MSAEIDLLQLLLATINLRAEFAAIEGADPEHSLIGEKDCLIEIQMIVADIREMTMMTFEEFSKRTRKRAESPRGFNRKLDGWSTSDWFLALFGELGEAANVAKKLNRARDGMPGNRESAEELRVKLRRELGDAYIYLDLLAQSLGFNIGDAALEVYETKSEEIGYVE